MTAFVAIFFITSLPGLVLLLFGLAAVDRMGQMGNRHLRLPWRRSEDGRSIAAPGLEEFDALYNSAKRHELRERRTSLMLRDEEGDAAPPRDRVDLDAGIAVIRRPDSPHIR
ncbi:DUF6191 domain-containing protein [Thermomonospora umbrina]|uniref:Uncharacterized protein n=1 Tax=Thermomonospora umbrina TaxID=111806 RepID=A0A3D9SW00_9ACTN|nr:DUF6191 domain-containing protein [Thermomonospora umbrina]REF00130.1 hypothetical protein DFJ69_5658 [Thermomonospora umbrina]